MMLRSMCVMLAAVIAVGCGGSDDDGGVRHVSASPVVASGATTLSACSSGYASADVAQNLALAQSMRASAAEFSSSGKLSARPRAPEWTSCAGRRRPTRR